MPENKTKLLVVLAVVVALCATAVVVAFPGRGQSPSGAEKPAAKTETTEIERPATKLTAATKPSAPNAAAATAVTGAPVSPAFATAVAQNLSLKYGLNWTFGGKQQRGWHLYTPLIGRLLETESDAGTPEFASALAGWQKGAGLAPSGVLDNDTWFRMFSTWQSRRLKNRGYAQPDHLLTAPASEFYDPSRPAELRQVDVEAYAAYKRMIAVAAADSSLGLALTADGELAPSEKYLKIIS
ncbi:MAG: hypothetical protein ACRD68_16690, partial [Pyrinomonadaceae bacterium]